MMQNPDKALFVGREEELMHLKLLANESFTGKAATIFVTGEAGSGKTFLIKEFFDQLKKEYNDVVIATGQCSVQSASYLPFQAILEDLLESHKKVKVTSKKFLQVMEIVVDTIWNVGPDMIGVFGIPIKTLQTAVDKLGLRGKKSAPELTIPKELDQVKIFGWYTKIMKDLSAHFPLILFIDDLHWADDSSLNLLLHLGRELEDQQILVVGTYRSHEISSTSLLMQVKTKLGRYGAKELPLDISKENPEHIEKTKQFVHDYLIAKYGTNFSTPFEQILTDRTEGNPLFLAEILKNLEEKKHIETGIDQQAASLVTNIERLEDLPEKVENAISERVNRLDQMSREILDYASVEGDDFIAQVIARIRQIQERNLISELTQKLMKAHQLIWDQGGKSLPNGKRIHEFSFRHNLIREYLYAQLSETNREFIHAEIGECLEQIYAPHTNEIASKLAVHFFYGHVLDKVIHYCLKASEDANRRYGTSEAVRFSKMGMEILEKQENMLSQEEYAEHKIRFLLELAKAEECGGDLQENKDHIQAGISYLETHSSLLSLIPRKVHGKFYAQLGELYCRKGSLEAHKAKRHLEKALEIYKSQNDEKNVAETLYRLADIYPYISTSPNDYSPRDRTIEVLKNSLLIAESLQDVKLQIRCLSSLTWNYIKMHFTEAEQSASQAFELLETLGESDKYIRIKVLQSMGGVKQGRALLKTGIQYLEESLKLARQIGDIFSETQALRSLGSAYNRYISLQKKAKRALEEDLSIRKQMGYRQSGSFTALGRLFIRQGRWKEAEECLNNGLKESSEASISFCRYYRGWFYMLRGQYKKAEEDFLYRIENLEQDQDFSGIVEYASTAVNYALMGDTTQCKEYIERAHQTCSKEDIRPRLIWRCFYVLSEAYRCLGELKTAKNICQRSLEGFEKNAEDAKDLYYVAEAQLIMGKILVDTKEYQKALSYLEKAKMGFENCQHHSLGEALLYLGRVYQGFGGIVFINQAKGYVNQAIAEFQRLELQDKEHEAKEFLRVLS